jgi:hypothetical protein
VNIVDLHYSDGIAAARTMIAVEASAGALQHRLPSGWELTPYAGADQRGTALRGANVLVPFHEVYPVRTRERRSIGLPQLSHSAFVSPALQPGHRRGWARPLVHLHRRRGRRSGQIRRRHARRLSDNGYLFTDNNLGLVLGRRARPR